MRWRVVFRKSRSRGSSLSNSSRSCNQIRHPIISLIRCELMFGNHANNAKLTWWPTQNICVICGHHTPMHSNKATGKHMNAGNLNTFIKCSILNKTGVLRVQYAILMLTINWLDSMPSDSEAHKWTWTHISTHLHHKLLVDVFLGYVWLKVGRL